MRFWRRKVGKGKEDEGWKGRVERDLSSDRSS